MISIKSRKYLTWKKSWSRRLINSALRSSQLRLRIHRWMRKRAKSSKHRQPMTHRSLVQLLTRSKCSRMCLKRSRWTMLDWKVFRLSKRITKDKRDRKSLSTRSRTIVCLSPDHRSWTRRPFYREKWTGTRSFWIRHMCNKAKQMCKIWTTITRKTWSWQRHRRTCATT